MTQTATRPLGAHLVGSMPLDDPADVFRTVGAALGPYLRRLPDGETGPQRKLYVGYQRRQFIEHPLLEAGPPNPDTALETAVLRPKRGVTPDAITFGDLGYARPALESWALFERMQAEGTLPAHLRFQVSLPLPLDAVSVFVAPDAQALVEPGYEAAMRREVATILDTIPHDRLAIQWDLCSLVWIWEGWVKADPAIGDLKPALIERVARVSALVPDAVELGYHLCYGDWGHQHLREPVDTANVVAIANGIASAVARPIQWVHLPVPIERTDDSFFAPLRGLRLHPETDLYLGLVHYRDGEDGTRARVETARRVLGGRSFGVATECGMGRRPPERGGAPETFRELLAVHAALADPVAEPGATA